MWIRARNGSYFITDFIYISEDNDGMTETCFAIEAIPRRGGIPVCIVGGFLTRESAQNKLDRMIMNWEDESKEVCVYV